MLISFVVIVFAVVMGVRMFKMWGEKNQLEEELAQLKAQYNKELQLSEQLKDEEQYVKTDEYVEEMARKLGLVYPNEVIFKPKE